MFKIKRNILIVGAGNLGSRYLQGLCHCSCSLNIFVLDTSNKSLISAKLLWNEVGGLLSGHDISFIAELRECPKNIDIAIISTTAYSRPSVVKSLALHSTVRFWILEKVLAQNTQGLDQILKYVKFSSQAWVNTSRRIMPWHNLVRERLKLKSPISLTVSGEAWNLASNAVHFLDFLTWWTGEYLMDVNCDRLNTFWIKGKREGDWDVYGTLIARFSGGSIAELTSICGNFPTLLIKLFNDDFSCTIDELNGVASFADGFEIRGKIPYQSELTTSLVDEILRSGCSLLPTLSESVGVHRPFINAILEHWQRNMDQSANIVPIT